MAQIIFLGTNGWYDSVTGNTISILIESEKYNIVLDAGNGIAKLHQYIKDDRPVYLFLSHFHLDHITGLHTLGINSFSKGLYLIVQEGGGEVLKRFVDFPFTIPLHKYPFHSEIIEVPQQAAQLPFKATVLPMVHSSYTLGIRLEVDGKIISYCPDTGYCENAVILGKEADVLITECAYRSGQVDPGWPHLNPELGARIALESGARKLVLTHFDAKKYPDLETRNEAARKAREIFRESYASTDGLEIEP